MLGTSLIPKIGSQTQNIPPIISVNESKVNSAAGMFLDPIEYKINPKHTKDPCVANKASFLLVERKLTSLDKIITPENKKQNKPAIATVVNFGVSFLHLNETEKIEKPIADTTPKTKPKIVFFSELPTDIIIIPIVAMLIATQTLVDIFSFKKRKPSSAVIKGIAAKQSRVIAAVVLVIDQIKVIIATPNPIPPPKPDIPILK